MDDLIQGATIADIGRLFRRGDLTIERLTRCYLDRVESLDGRLGAYEFVAAENAMAIAHALDRMLAVGVDLGPLMGIPIAVKDIIAVDGMPTSGGSNVDIAGLVNGQGRFVVKLRRLGCVILGKTKTVEFAFGPTGINTVRGTPWNPWDRHVHRVPGGSSSGSAVAVAAGLCALAVGTDTGGSVRVPSALCGTFGLKTTHGRWPLDGVLPLAPTFDTIGLLARSAADAATAFAAISDEAVPPPPPIASLRLARPGAYYFDDLDEDVRSATGAAIAGLQAAGAGVVDIDVPEAREREAILPTVLASELVATLGRERFAAERDTMDPLIAARIARGLEITADQYILATTRHRQLVGVGAERMSGHDGWISPTTAMVAPRLDDLRDVEHGIRIGAALTRNTQPGNLFGQCAVSMPVGGADQAFPVGLQIIAAPGGDARLLSIALAAEKVLGMPRFPDTGPFAS